MPSEAYLRAAMHGRPAARRVDAVLDPAGADVELTSFLRLAVASAAFAMYRIDPSDDPHRQPYAYAVLAAFVAYSATTHVLALRRVRSVPAAVAPWIDLGWVTLLIAVSDATSSIFYPLYLFVILCGALGRGFRSGMAVVVSSVLSFAIVGGISASHQPTLPLERFLIRPLYLFVLGYLVSRWAGHEVRLRARLALLRDVTALSNPRFGIDRTVTRLLSSLRAFYDAQSCRLVVADDHSGDAWMRTVTRGRDGGERVILPGAVRAVLLPDSPTAALVFRHRWAPFALRRVPDLDRIDTESSGSDDGAAVDQLAALLDARSFISVPFRYGAEAVGRLYLSSDRDRAFERGDVDFLAHIVNQVAPVLENVRLVDRLASDAAEEERRRIARDIHDSAIQPIVGLRLGLSAAQQALASGRVRDAAGDLERLARIVEGEIESLRGYVRGLHAARGPVETPVLPIAVRRFCGRFSLATGIRVEVAADRIEPVSDRLAAEVFQIVSEALSNVRRHTDATWAHVRMDVRDNRLHVEVANDGAPEEARNGFTPRSIRDRARTLGGALEIDHPAAGTTAVRVQIPL